MALKSTITSSVNSAFNLIGDLGEIITFTNSTVSEYNFNNHSVTKTTLQPVTIKGIVSKQYKNISDNPRLLSDITLKSADVDAVELDGYDIVNFRSRDWKINSIDDNGFIVKVTVAREI